MKPVIVPQPPPRMAHQPAVFGNAPLSRRTNYLIAASDVNSLLQLAADTIVIVALNVITSATYHTVGYGSAVVPRREQYAGIIVALVFAAVSRLTVRRHGVAVTTTYDRLRDSLISWTLAFGALTFVLFILKSGAATSRGALLSFYLAGVPAIALWRVFAPLAISPLVRRAGSAMRECIVIGDISDSLVEKFAVELRTDVHPAPTILKFRATCLTSQWQSELDYLAEKVTDVALRHGPGEIYICAGSIPADRLASISRRLKVLPRAIFVVPDAQTATLVHCKPTSVGNYVALETRREPLGPWQRVVKRLMDILIAGTGLVLLSPFLLIIAIAVKLDSKGPVLFRQKRNGYRGRPFRILKFRSMHVLEDGPFVRQASRQDTRVTRVGRILRRTSIDELPQLVNILVGDMSLVGPRPHAQAHDEFYARSIENYQIRQHVKPGLTGWAQVNGLRGETATVEAMYRRIDCDLWYAANASIFLDIEILLRTAIEVVRHRNAY